MIHTWQLLILLQGTWRENLCPLCPCKIFRVHKLCYIAGDQKKAEIVGLWKYTPAGCRSGRNDRDRGLESFGVNRSFGIGQRQWSPECPGLLYCPTFLFWGQQPPLPVPPLGWAGPGLPLLLSRGGTLIILSQTSWRVWPIRPQNSHHTHTRVWLKATKAGQSDFCSQKPLTSLVPKPPGCQSTHPVSIPGGGKPQGSGRNLGERSSLGKSELFFKSKLALYTHMKLFLTCKQFLTSASFDLLAFVSQLDCQSSRHLWFMLLPVSVTKKHCVGI